MRARATRLSLARLLILAALTIALPGVFAACGSSANTGPVHDVASLADHLRNEGATVQLGEKVTHPFLAVPGQIMTVNGTDLEVFQYASAKALADDTRLIDPDGCIGTLSGGMLNPWTAPPHFYKSEGVMVIYLGSDPKMLQLLTKVMGKQFAGK